MYSIKSIHEYNFKIILLIIGKANTEFIHEWYAATDGIFTEYNILESQGQFCSTPSFTIDIN